MLQKKKKEKKTLKLHGHPASLVSVIPHMLSEKSTTLKLYQFIAVR